MKKITFQKLLFTALVVFIYSFSNAQNYFSQNTTSGLPTSVYKFDIADLENDGDLDILISDYSDAKVYTNDGSGNFTLLSGTAFSTVTYDDANVKFIDIDGDNDQDVLIISYVSGGSSASQLYRNDGGNTFTLMNTFPSVNMYTTAIGVGDLDNDNDNDIIITGNQGSGSNMTYSPFINDGSGNFGTVLSSTPQRWENSSGQYPIIGELNGDNINDYIITFYSNKHLMPSFGIHPLLSGLSPNINQNAAMADFDGDGDNDVFGNLGESNYILFNDGAANFTQSSQVLSAGKGTGLIATGDVDNDGDIDILRKGQNAAENSYLGGLYINDGKGYFYQNTSVSIPNISTGTSMFADLNGDNYPELIVCDEFTMTLYNNTFTTNHPDQALDFDGTNHYSANHNAALNTLPMTVEFWMNGGSITQIGLIQKGSLADGLQVGLVGGQLYVDYRSGSSSNSLTLNQVYDVSDGNWHHIAIVIESTGAKLYGDGIERATASWTGIPSAMTNTANLELGKWSYDTNIFTGSLDEVRIWNTARTQAEIINNMCGKISNSSADANLVAYYSMDDYITGYNFILDESNNNNIMNISGGSQTLAAEQVGCTAPVVPVELIDFTGKLINDNVVLNWQTVSEENNYGFEIERSTNGQDWETIGFVQGNGTTVDISDYEFIDKNLTGLYYRLKQLDYDGNHEYSKVVNIQIAEVSGQTIKIFPNPTSDILNIEITKPTFIQILNITGQAILEKQITERERLDVSNLENGFYFIKIGNEMQKILIQH